MRKSTCVLVVLGFAVSISLQPRSGAAAERNATIKVAMLQMRPEKDDVPKNLAKAEDYCRRAADAGADVAIMPEMWSVGYTGFDAKRPGAREAFQAKALRKESAAVQHFAALAKELDMAIGLTYLQAHDPAPWNSITLFDRHGSEVFTYDKVHTCDFSDLESATDPGVDFRVGRLDTKAGNVEVGAMICFDREQPESARILMLKGAELILTPNACFLDTLRLEQFKIRAWENVVGVAMANYPSPELNGHSCAYDAAGKCLVQAGKEEGLVLGSFDLKELREQRRSSIWGNAYRRPHRYDLLKTPAKDPVWRRKSMDGTPYDSLKR
jgi:N-carbamoylputrescine amidase